MSNHVQIVFKPFLSEAALQESFDEHGRPLLTSDHPGLSRIMHSLKGSSARECNLILSRAGQFWEHESFDHFVRDGKFLRRSVMFLIILSKLVWLRIGKSGAGIIAEVNCRQTLSRQH